MKTYSGSGTRKAYREDIFDHIGYTPQAVQVPVHESEARFKLVAGGERGGKSKTGSIEAVLACANPLTELIWLVGPDYDGAMEEFKYIWGDMEKLGLLENVSQAHQGSLWMTLSNGNVAVTKSSMDPRKLGMQAPGYILMTEAARQHYIAFLRVMGRAGERRAPVCLTGTFEGASESGVTGSWYAEVFNQWQVPNEDGGASFSLPSWDNLIVYPGGRKDPEILRLERRTPEDMFQERYGAVPCKPSGLVLPEFNIRKHVGHFPYNPDIPVEIAVDPGYGYPGAAAVLAIQVKEGDCYIIAEIYKQHLSVHQIITKCKQDWPFFGEIQAGAIDIAAKAHPGGLEPVVEVWRKETGIFLSMRYARLSTRGAREGTVELLRTFLKLDEHGRPKTFVDFSCQGFIAECGGGPSPVDGGGAWLRHPDTHEVLDSNCHSTKAYGYWLVNRFGYSPISRAQSRYGKLLVPDRRGRLRPRRTGVSVGGNYG